MQTLKVADALHPSETFRVLPPKVLCLAVKDFHLIIDPANAGADAFFDD
jgi:hypothetical protein